MGRRDQVMTDGEEQLIRQIYADTADERTAALDRMKEKRLERS